MRLTKQKNPKTQGRWLDIAKTLFALARLLETLKWFVERFP